MGDEDNGKGEHIDHAVNARHQVSLNRWPSLKQAILTVLAPVGFEAHPFHIGWYNELVGTRFHLNYPNNTVALVVISGPDTYEKCVIPFVKSLLEEDVNCPRVDALDGSMKEVFKQLLEELIRNNFDAEAIHDFEMYPSRKPKVLVQTAAHVAGAAEYYHKDRVNNNNPSWLKDSKLFGVAIHPEYGGWFAIRGVFILKNLVLEELLQKPERPLPQIDESLATRLLEEFGMNWKDHVWRDLLPRSSDKKYSQYFINYLATAPDKRWEYVKSSLCFADEWVVNR